MEILTVNCSFSVYFQIINNHTSTSTIATRDDTFLLDESRLRVKKKKRILVRLIPNSTMFVRFGEISVSFSFPLGILI